MTTYPYTKTPVAIDRLTKEIQLAGLATALDYVAGISLSGDALSINFVADLSDADKTALDAIVAAHSGLPLAENVPQQVNVQNIPVVTTQYELNDKDLKLARAYAAVDADTHKASLSMKVPGTFGTDGRYITGGYATTEDYDKDDYALVWVEDDDRCIAMVIALAMDPSATAPVSDDTIKGMGIIPGFGLAMPNYPVVKAYYDDEADVSNQGWYFWPTAQGNNLDPVGETEVETIAGFAFIPSNLYLKIDYIRVSKTTGGIRVNFFWGRKG